MYINLHNFNTYWLKKNNVNDSEWPDQSLDPPTCQRQSPSVQRTTFFPFWWAEVTSDTENKGSHAFTSWKRDIGSFSSVNKWSIIIVFLMGSQTFKMHCIIRSTITIPYLFFSAVDVPDSQSHCESHLSVLKISRLPGWDKSPRLTTLPLICLTHGFESFG